MNRLLERWGNFWDFIRDHIAEGSRIYKRLRIEHGIPELEEELGELRAEKEAFDQYREEDQIKLQDARNLAKHAKALRKLAEEKMLEAQEDAAKLKQEVSVLREKIAVSVPIYALGNMINNSQSAGMYVNADDYVLIANKEAVASLMSDKRIKRVAGANLLELASEEFVERLRNDVKNNGSFRIEYAGNSSPFQGWYVGVARDKDVLYGFLMSSDISFLRKAWSLVSGKYSLKRFTRRSRQILVPGQFAPEILPEN
jgi:hypothetical protein